MIPMPTCVGHAEKSMPTCDSHMLPCVRHMEKSMPTCVSHMDPCILHCLLYAHLYILPCLLYGHNIPMLPCVRHKEKSMPIWVSHMEPCILHCLWHIQVPVLDTWKHLYATLHLIYTWTQDTYTPCLYSIQAIMSAYGRTVTKLYVSL